MSGNRFDEETCGIATGGSGRRGVLKGLAASGLVAAVSRITGRPATAKKKNKGPCGKCGALCDTRTALIRCDPNNEECVCVRSTSGKSQCVGGEVACPDPGTPDACQRDADCDPGSICFTTGGLCCPDLPPVNLCVALCTTAAGMAKSGKGKGNSLLGGPSRLVGR